MAEKNELTFQINNYGLLPHVELYDDNDILTDIIKIQHYNNDTSCFEDVEEIELIEGIETKVVRTYFDYTADKCRNYNQSIINWYSYELERTQRQLNKEFISVHQFNSGRTLSDWQLLKRQLTSYEARISIVLNTPMRGGYIINNEIDLVTFAFNEYFLGFGKLLQLAKIHLDVVNQQIEKLNPLTEKTPFIDERTFEPLIIFKIHEALNNNLFYNTIPELYMALNSPSNMDYKINFIASNKTMVYYFISRLSHRFNNNMLPTQMCKKQNILDRDFSVGQSKALNGSNNEREFVKLFDKVLNEISVNKNKTK